MAQQRQELTDTKAALRTSQAQQSDAQKKVKDLWLKVRNLESANKVGGKQQTQQPTGEIKKQMLKDPRALVVPDGTSVISEK